MLLRPLLLICLFCCVQMVAAQHLNLQFVPAWGGKPVDAQKYYKLPSGDSLQISNFRCYISGISLSANGKTVYTEPNSYHLLDMAEPPSMQLRLPNIPKYDAIHFSIGVDSIMSISGAHGGDLDPEKGMYWAWQSGYINFKVEGNSNLCNTRRNEFQFHIGGYAGKDNALVKVTLRNADAPNTMTIQIPLDKWLQQIDISQQHTIMSPSAEAVQLAKQFAATLNIQQP
jgi:hypothetical protein